MASTESENHGSVVKSKSDKGIHRSIEKLPINEVGLFSYSLMTWMSGLIWGTFKNQRRSLSKEDLWECSEEEGIRSNTKRIQHLWNEELLRNKDKASFYNVWIRFIWLRSLFGFFLLCVNVITTFAASGLLLNKTLGYLESDYTNISYGIGLVVAVFSCEMMCALTINIMQVYCFQTGTRFRSGVMGIVYEKLLRMKTINGQTNSELINVFSVDSQRVYMATCSTVFILTAPLYIVIGTVYCYILIGYWGFIAVGMLIFCYIFQTRLAKYIGPIRMKCVKYADKRLQRMRETISNMKFIKMYAWEKPFTDYIKDVRKLEKKCLEQSALLIGLISSIVPIIPTVTAVITITAYAATGNQLTASKIFALIGTMNFLRGMGSRIPGALKLYAEVKVSLQRIEKLLLLEEYTKPMSTVFNKENAIEIKNADFAIDANSNEAILKTLQVELEKTPDDGRFHLSDVHFKAKKGKLIGISGPVGSGKSSLMLAILGRLEKVKGHLAVNGKVAYVPQQPWIFNATIKENILFGSNFDLNRYDDVVRSCCLDTDISTMQDGHDTEIGERGTNLSGGQKQRVSLARAVYSDRDIYILDDPFSALDMNVGKHIFHQCIQGLLKTKTVLLITHHIQYLKQCDDVVFMNNGTVVQNDEGNDLLDEMVVRLENDDQGKPSPLMIESTDISTTSDKNMENKNETRGLVRAEVSSTGNITFDVYKSYVNSAGGFCVAIIVIGLFALAAALILMTEWWLSKWITSGNMITNLHPSPSRNESYISKSSSHFGIAPELSINETNDLLSNNSIIAANDVFSSISGETYLIVYVSSLAWILLLQVAKSVAETKAVVKASDGLHSRCLNKVMKATMYFFDSTPVGRILNRFSKDLDECDSMMPSIIFLFLDLFIRFLIGIVISAYVTPWFLVAFVPLAILFCILKQISFASIRELKRFENVSRSPLLNDVNATSVGLFSIVAYEQQEKFIERVADSGSTTSMSLLLFEIGAAWIAIRLDIIAGFLTVMSCLICVALKGHLEPASAGLILSMCGKTNSTMKILIMSANKIEATFTAVERLCEYSKAIETEPQTASKTVDENWPGLGHIIFKNVTMRYMKDSGPVLRSVNIEINHKEKVGIIGRTGAGKSSLIVALLRLVELESGMITIDSEDISKLSLSAIRSKIATITQEPVLFSGSVRYNLDPFNVCSDEELWSALDKTRMKDKIKQLNGGLSAMVQERGGNFSVGECQLLCLARALLRNSKILLLDEATSNIDAASDAMIQETIRTCFADCTVITIAHRLDSVLHCDKIVVLDSGQVKEFGSPSALLSDPESYLSATQKLIIKSEKM